MTTGEYGGYDDTCICDFPRRCGGMGLLKCLGCGGDQCVCAACFGQGTEVCPGCCCCELVVFDDEEDPP